MHLDAPHTLAPSPAIESRTDGALDVAAALTFITPQAAKPRFYSQAYTGGEPRYDFAVETRTVPISDLRPLAPAFDPDRNGFALRRVPTEVADLYDDEAVRGAYVREVESLLTAAFGAGEVAVFDLTRRSDGGGGAANPDGRRGPATRIHVDYTAASGPRRARDVLGAQVYDRVLARGGRIRQVNVWRPIRGPVLRSPLALADAATVAEADLVATDQVFPDRVGEIYHLAHNPSQRWYYAPRMTPDEVLLIKGWDSAEAATARFTPHSAFAAPDEGPATPARESIEARAFVVTG